MVPPVARRSRGAAAGGATLRSVLVARSGVSPVLVGREAELAALDRMRVAVQTSDVPPIAVISGEAGVGKSRLVRELTTRSNWPLLASSAEPVATPRPFALIRDAMTDRVRSWSSIPTALTRREDAVRHVLAPLVDDGPAPGDGVPPSDELEQAAVEILRDAVDSQPTWLVFEDLHWADLSSIGVLVRLASTPDLPVAIVVTLRPEDLDRRHPAAAALADLERRQQVTRISLDRLSRRDLAAMLDAVYDTSVPHAAVLALHERTHGNPFFVEELIAGSGVSDPAQLAEVDLPWNVAEAVLRRIDDLDPADRRVLDVAALLGQRIPFDVLAAVTELDEDELISALRHLVERGLLREPATDEFSFRHALTREAAASRLLGRERRRIHDAAYTTLIAAGSSDHAALARHAAGAGRDADLVTAAVAGVADAYSEGAHLVALHLAELAIDGTSSLTEGQALTLHRGAARAALALGALDDAEDHTAEWIDLATRRNDPAEHSFALRALGSLRHLRNDNAGHREAVEEAVAVAEPLGPSAELAWALSYRSRALMLTGEPEEAIIWADKALAMAEEVGCAEVRPYTLVNKGTALADSGHLDEGLALLAQGRQEAHQRGDLLTQGRAVVNATMLIVDQTTERQDELADLVAEADRLSECHGLDVSARHMDTMTRVVAGLRNGDLEAVRAAGDPRTFGGPGPHKLDGTILGVHLAIEDGDIDAAESRLVCLSAADDWAIGTPTEHATARTRIAAGRGDAECLATGLAQLATADLTLVARTTAELATFVAALVESHRAGAADADWAPVAARVREIAVPGRAVHDAHLAIVDGLEALRRGDTDAGADILAEVGAIAELPMTAWLRAELDGLAATALAEAGRTDDARELAVRAAGRLARWPGWRRDRLEVLARRLGARSEADGDAGGVLTPREREVLALIAEGRSNREIAEALYIAQKTAAVHVSNILAKTGTASRTEAATWAIRNGLVDA